MAERTTRREAGLGVIGVVGALEIPDVTGRAIRRNAVEITVRVALRALQRCVRAGQRERRFAVIERCTRPGGRRMAQAAIHRETGFGVVGIARVAEIAEVARTAVRRDAREIAVAVALVALQSNVGARQREGRFGMVERRAGPGSGGMAEGAIHGEPGLGMVRVRRAIEVLQMTRAAVGSKRGEIPAGVAL